MKLQLKRSNVLDGGSAKEPTAAQVEYGELCVNYNTSDPALFIKDSNDVIIRIAGAGAVGEGETPSGPILPDTGNKPGDVFFNETNNTLYYWNGSDWVPIASQENAADIFVGTFDEVDAAIAVDDRANGLLLWETTEGQLYIWYIDADTKQWVQAVPASGGGGGGSSVSVLPNAPSVAAQGDLWYCTSDGRLYVYYDDNATTQWVDASPDDLAPVVHSGEIWPSTATEDDLFFNTTDGRLYIYYNDGDSTQWVDASPDTQNYTDDWVRNGTTLSPANAGDDVDLGTGDLSAAAITQTSSGTEVYRSENGQVILRKLNIYAPGGDSKTDPGVEFSHAAGESYITVSSDLGSGAFAIKSNSSSAARLYFKSVGNIDENVQIYRQADDLRLSANGGEVLVDQNVKIGGTLPASPNITLNAAGIITCGTNTPGGGAAGDINCHRMLVGSQSVSQQFSIGLVPNGTTNYSFAVRDTGLVSIGNSLQSGNLNSDNITLQVGGTINAVNQSIQPAFSERRMKQNIVEIDKDTAWDTVRDVPFREFEYRRNPDRKYYGNIVDEVEAVEPSLVVPSLLEDDEEGPIRTIDTNKLNGYLAVALQTALTRIEALEAKVQQLEGGN